MRLMEERISHPDKYTDEGKPIPREFEDSNLYHYAIFSDNVLAASVVVNSATKNAKEPWKHVFHVVTDKMNHGAMQVMFKLKDYNGAHIEVKAVGIGEPAKKDLTGLWKIHKDGKVNGAVETCSGSFHREKCTEEYHYWQNLNENRTLWKLGTFPPGLITFYSTTMPLDKPWHVLGLGYNPSISIYIAAGRRGVRITSSGFALGMVMPSPSLISTGPPNVVVNSNPCSMQAIIKLVICNASVIPGQIVDLTQTGSAQNIHYHTSALLTWKPPMLHSSLANGKQILARADSSRLMKSGCSFGFGSLSSHFSLCSSTHFNDGVYLFCKMLHGFHLPH
ncbi:Galacturonosyltransferase 8 [Hibiscus syriacus]|uniref:Hexosyltransferase n=1 Tax=Hibiscus syriacus TaxID=106335 RepID=A0A6A3AX55_HIBSY|nr:Galacturonosyltransferase 8 [Hibiscus syriacus]